MTIAITGGAGSLGKAFVKLLSKDHELIIIDSNEWAVAELQQQYPSMTVRLIDFGDYRFEDAPDVLIHLAAYKHVNLGETNVASFVENNVTKTHTLFRRAKEMATKILFVSTDKAVEPISLYGFTKAIGEHLTYEYDGSVARLGNIIGSSGSVIPAWEAAIRAGEPVKVTDPEMTRYMIEADDAVSQIWKQFEERKQLIIPEMGEPKPLMQIVLDVLKKHNYPTLEAYEPGITVIGRRSGEKQHEKLKWETGDRR